MARPNLADRVKETTTTTGTGTVSLAGAVSGFIRFFVGYGDLARCYYCIRHLTSNEWEVGMGTITEGSPDTLSRDRVLSSSTGNAIDFSAGTKQVFGVLPAYAGDAFPEDYIQGLRVEYISSTQVTVYSGRARDDEDDSNINFDSTFTPNIANLQVAGGLDEKDLTGTTASNNGTTLTGTGTAFLTEFGTRDLNDGTIGTGGSPTTTITGTSTKFLSEVALDDLIGNSSVGYARVTAIASNTSLTVSSNLTITNGSTGTVIENATVKHDVAGTPQPRRVDAIASDTSLTVTSAFTGGSLSGKDARAGCEVVSTWFYLWLITYTAIPSGLSIIYSTQRTTPLSGPAGTTILSQRLIGVVVNDSSGNFEPFDYDGYLYRYRRANTWLISSGSATTNTVVTAKALVPPIAKNMMLRILGIHSSTTAPATLYVQPNSATDFSDYCRVDIGAMVSGTTDTRSSNTGIVVNFGQAFMYRWAAAGTGLEAWIDASGFVWTR